MFEVLLAHHLGFFGGGVGASEGASLSFSSAPGLAGGAASVGHHGQANSQQLFNWNDEEKIHPPTSTGGYWDSWYSNGLADKACSTNHLGQVHCHWGYAMTLMDDDFWGDQRHLCRDGDDTGCNGPDGEEWVDEGYRDRATPSAGAVQKITHTTRECLRMAGKGEYPENCAYKSYDPAVNHDYSGRTRVPAA